MTPKQEAAMRQALEALEFYPVTVNHWKAVLLPAAQAIREALAEQPAQQQEPAAWRWTESNGQHWFDWRTDWTHHDRAKAMGFAIEYAYTSPPASKPWVGLTDQEIRDWWRIENGLEDCQLSKLVDFTLAVRAIEAKLKEKNA